MADAAMFLDDEEIATLTGIRRGQGGVSRDALQAEHLRKIGVPFYLNRRGRPLVVREVLTGARVVPAAKPKWTPRPLQG